MNADPVHEAGGEWFFWDETWGERHGPFSSREVARSELARYCVFGLGDLPKEGVES